MDRVAVFVDAGYLFAAGSEALLGTKRPRSALTLDARKVTTALKTFAEKVSDAPLLRIYWYDGTAGAPSSQHLTMAYCEHVKLRLGFVNTFGEQKGVDSLIVTDMITLARNGAMCDAVLMSGDEDLRVGVQQAQERGVRVHLLGISANKLNQSGLLRQEADATHDWDAGDLKKFLREATPIAKDPPRVPLTAEGSETLKAISEAVVKEIKDDDFAALVGTKQSNTVPEDIDKLLLGAAARTLRRRLTSDEVRDLRRAFFAAITARAGKK